MRGFVVAILVVFASWMQLTYPSALAPWHVIPDVSLLVVIGLALYYQPIEQVFWWALLSGLAIDIWHPSQFGTWTLASLLVAAVAVGIHHRVLPRLSRPGVIVTGGIALVAGLTSLYVVSTIGADLGLWHGLKLFSRLFLVRFAIDMVLMLPIVYVVRRLALWLNPYQGGLRPIGQR